MGPLEQEIKTLMDKKVLADPALHGMVLDNLSDRDLAALGTNRSAKTDELFARMIGGVREGVERLAREIDAINAASNGRN